MQDFDTALQAYFEGCKRIASEYYAKQGYTQCDVTKWRIDQGPRYCRIVSETSAHSFVDRTNGNVLKAAGWKAPAKHARGNIYDESNGLKLMGPYGPAYLR